MAKGKKESKKKKPFLDEDEMEEDELIIPRRDVPEFEEDKGELDWNIEDEDDDF